MDHTRCHWCGEVGHRAFTCAAAAAAHDEAMVDVRLAPAAAPVRDPNDGTNGGGGGGGGGGGDISTKASSSSAAATAATAATAAATAALDLNADARDSTTNATAAAAAAHDDVHDDDDDVYVYVAGGRNRGQTVGVTERYSLRRRCWERGPHITEPRGSHGLAAARGTVYAVAGGGIRSNLHSAEALDVPSPSTSADAASTWRPAGRVEEARHAVSACSTGDWGVYAVGGWANGNVCTGAVDFLDLRDRGDGDGDGDGDNRDNGDTTMTWKSLAPLNTPRKLHAVAGLPDGRLFTFGGRVSDEARVGPIKSAERYDPRDDAWKPAADLPFGACACAASDGGHVYVMTWGASSEGWVKGMKGGGGGGGGGNAAAAAAASGGGSEKQRAKKERKRLKREAAAAAAAAADDAAGGEAAATATTIGGDDENTADSRNGGGEAGALWRYDPEMDTYTWLSHLPLPEWYGFAAAAHDGWVYAVGGSTSGRWTGAAYRYRVSGGGIDGSGGGGDNGGGDGCGGGGGGGCGGWEELPAMKMVRRRTAAAVVVVPRPR